MIETLSVSEKKIEGGGGERERGREGEKDLHGVLE